MLDDVQYVLVSIWVFCLFAAVVFLSYKSGKDKEMFEKDDK